MSKQCSYVDPRHGQWRQVRRTRSSLLLIDFRTPFRTKSYGPKQDKESTRCKLERKMVVWVHPMAKSRPLRVISQIVTIWAAEKVVSQKRLYGDVFNGEDAYNCQSCPIDLSNSQKAIEYLYLSMHLKPQRKFSNTYIHGS